MEQSLFPDTETTAPAQTPLIFLDTETTGTEFGKDRICQVCFLTAGKIRTEYFRPPFLIPVKAMSVHHITNKMVENKPAFAGSAMQRDLQSRLKDGILVAHNARFDIGMLEAEDVKVARYICTYRVALFLDRESTIPEYNLQYLRYYLNLDVEAIAHDAEGDVKVLFALFQWLLQKMRQEKASEAEAIAAMVEISSQPLLFRKFSFGKYKDQAIAEVAQHDRGYLEWFLAQKQKNPDGEDDWIYTLNYYLQRR